MSALIFAAGYMLLGAALTLAGGWLVAGYHLWRRRGDEAEWCATGCTVCPDDCECQREDEAVLGRRDVSDADLWRLICRAVAGR